ncbi:MAG: cell division protein FtsZ [Parcubacteria group bacterium Gr01-1014_106]|nr:MAG: cell division protein FtsZ [Parcubacteria group bacterium Gr01-1014_106]
MPEVKPKIETFAKIRVVGVGGSGGNALHRMMEARIRGVEFIAVNTDAQALHHSAAPHKIHIGQNLTRGLGAGMDPSVGQQAAEEAREEIYEALKGSDMVFVTGGMGGGTCTGAAPVVAEIAKESGALTIGVVTKPFAFEGQQRRLIADEGLAELHERVDAAVIIPNDRLLQMIDRKTSLLDAFRVVDDVLRQGVQGISDLITEHGMVNLDFADVRAVMTDAGTALMGIGRSSGENRAVEAARAAIDSPLLDVSIDGAKGILFNVSGGKDLGMYEVEEAARIITEHADPSAKVIFGAVVDDQNDKEEIVITVVATGFDSGKLEPLSRERARVSVQPARPAQTYGRTQPVAPAPPVASRPVSPAPSGPRPDGGTAPQEDFDIPAFIRKKMKT